MSAVPILTVAVMVMVLAVRMLQAWLVHRLDTVVSMFDNKLTPRTRDLPAS